MTDFELLCFVCLFIVRKAHSFTGHTQHVLYSFACLFTAIHDISNIVLCRFFVVLFFIYVSICFISLFFFEELKTKPPLVIHFLGQNQHCFSLFSGRFWTGLRRECWIISMAGISRSFDLNTHTLSEFHAAVMMATVGKVLCREHPFPPSSCRGMATATMIAFEQVSVMNEWFCFACLCSLEVL